MTKKKTSTTSPLRSKIEKVALPEEPGLDSTFGEVEEFVPGLIDEISLGLPLPTTDLNTKQSAAKAVADLSQKLDQLKRYQHRVQALRDLLVQKKHTLISAAEESLGANWDKLDNSEE